MGLRRLPEGGFAMPPPTRPSRPPPTRPSAAPIKRKRPQAKKTISKKPSTSGKRNKSVKKKPAGRPTTMSPASWLKVMNCAITGLEYAGMEAIDDASDERLFLVCEELREILKIAERILKFADRVLM
jgi:hypothetical protein